MTTKCFRCHSQTNSLDTDLNSSYFNFCFECIATIKASTITGRQVNNARERYCSKCARVKPIDAFTRRRNGLFFSACKECNKYHYAPKQRAKKQKQKESTRNPPWSRDELIVALEFYLRHAPSIPDQGSIEVSSLSAFLNRLGQKLGGDTSPTYRNPNGVYLKMMNLRRFDPDYQGRGMQRGNKDEEAVWNLYASKPNELLRIVESIRSLVKSDEFLPFSDMLSDDEVEAEEGQVLTRMHRYRERDAKLVKGKKKSVFGKTGRLRCEVCEFDFSLRYGEHGDGFIECHHTKPVSELKTGERTKLSDLSLVCSNCHRMIHRRRPWLSVRQLSEILGSD